MPPEYLAALKAFAFQSGVPLAEYVRGIVHDHILQRGAAFRERGAALRALINAGARSHLNIALDVVLIAWTQAETALIVNMKQPENQFGGAGAH
jgi:hypothetical protein